MVLYGGTGQAKVVRPILEHYGSKVIAVIDDTPGLPSTFPDVPLYQGWDGLLKAISQHPRNEIGFVVAIGNPHGRVRIALHEKMVALGLQPVSLAHPSAIVSDTATFGSGLQVMAGAIIGELVHIGRECIINTNASVDHECVLEDGVEIAPGATLCGNIRMRTNSWACTGATITPRRTIGADSIVGAGSVVLHDIPEGMLAIGSPARPVRSTIKK